MISKDLMPNSQCSLRENPKFLQNFRPKNNTLKNNCKVLILFNIYHFNWGLAFKNKSYDMITPNLCAFGRRKFTNLTSKMHVSFLNEALEKRKQIDDTRSQYYQLRTFSRELRHSIFS
jgi:hypothetical protein